VVCDYKVGWQLGCHGSSMTDEAKTGTMMACPGHRWPAQIAEPMSTREFEVEALKLAPRERARLAEKLLESLENLLR
jgi:hypothetical protein